MAEDNLGLLLEQPENDLDVIVADDDLIEGALDQVGALPKGHPRRKKYVARVRKALVRMSKRPPATNDLTAKAEFEKRIGQLPKEIQRALARGKLQIVDGDIYSVKSISKKQTIDLLESSDDKQVGISNLNSAKLDSNKYFLITAIELSYCADAGGINGTSLQEANFKDDLPSVLKNGEFQLEQDSDVLIPEISCEVFVNQGRTDIKKGLYKLENPKFLKPLKEITPELKLSGVAPENSALKFRLIGATIAKY